jgi:hypothetical protein
MDAQHKTERDAFVLDAGSLVDGWRWSMLPFESANLR